MVWLSGLLPYEQAAQVFERIGHCPAPAASIWRQTRAHGERMQARVEREQERVGPERVRLPPAGQDHRQRMGVSMDGGMLNLRGEGFKEFKVGTVFEVEQRLERDPLTKELTPRAHGAHMVYTAVLGSAAAFGPALWALAVQAEVPRAAECSVTADGAEWIWNLAADYFPDSVQIVDWYHACEHLAGAAATLYPDDPQTAQAWFRQQRNHLYLGELQAVTRPLDQAGLTDQSQYFHTHQRRMQYQEFQEAGYPIGSGTVESGIKQFKARLTGSGMRWSRPAAQQMLTIRGAVLANTFDALWALA